MGHLYRPPVIAAFLEYPVEVIPSRKVVKVGRYMFSNFSQYSRNGEDWWEVC